MALRGKIRLTLSTVTVHTELGSKSKLHLRNVRSAVRSRFIIIIISTPRFFSLGSALPNGMGGVTKIGLLRYIVP